MPTIDLGPCECCGGGGGCGCEQFASVATVSVSAVSVSGYALASDYSLTCSRDTSTSVLIWRGWEQFDVFGQQQIEAEIIGCLNRSGADISCSISSSGLPWNDPSSDESRFLAIGEISEGNQARICSALHQRPADCSLPFSVSQTCQLVDGVPPVSYGTISFTVTFENPLP